jgi:Glycosyltransferase family 87
MKQNRCRAGNAAALMRMLQLTIVAGLSTVGIYYLFPTPPGVHYVQYRVAADQLMAGRSLYDLDAQSRLQSAIPSEGKRPFLPYFYPPWFALACAPLSLLPYRAAEVLYLFLTCLCLVLSGSLLHDAAPGVSRWATIMVVVGFFPSLFAAQTSQTSPLILLLAATLWRSLDRGRDRLAGFALAWLTIKPQLSIGIIIGGLLWSARRRRWGVLGAFTVTLGLLCLACTALDHSWPLGMLRATKIIALPTEAHPEIGVTWPLLLRTFGFASWKLVVAYAALAFTAMAIVVGSAWDRSRGAGELIGKSSIAAFAIAPYAQFYDLPVLLISLFGIIGHRQPTGRVFGLMLALLVLPYLNFFALLFAGWRPCTFAWVPATLAIAWLAKSRAPREALINSTVTDDAGVPLQKS